jgi:hypothetical protein
MAKKKAQHLYELLGQKAEEKPRPAAAGQGKERPAPQHARRPFQPPSPAPPPAQVPRKHITAPPQPVPAPVPLEAGHEHVLENVITIRRDTAIVGALLIIVVIAVAFVLGYAAAPKYVEDDTPKPTMERDSSPAGPAQPPVEGESAESSD